MLAGDRRLARSARDEIQTAESVEVSVVSAWEIALKAAAGKLKSPPDLERAILDSGLTTTSLHFADVAEAERLPLHHGDPFDRMLVAQARVRGLTLMTRDEQLGRYAVPLLLI